MKAYINACKSLIKEKKTTILYIITEDRELIDAIKKNIPEIDIIVASNKQAIQDDLMEMGIKIKTMKETPLDSIATSRANAMLADWGGVEASEEAVSSGEFTGDEVWVKKK